MTDLDDAWRAALAAEQQAVYGYGLVGPNVPPADVTLARTCAAAHLALVSAIEAQMADQEVGPWPQPADYPELYPVQPGDAARRLALRLEDQTAVAWRALYAQAVATGGAQGRTLRAQGQNGITAAAVRAVQWRYLLTPTHASVAFPGIPGA